MKSTLSVTAPVLVALAAAVSGAHATGRYDAEYNVISKGSLQTSGIGKEATAHPLCLDNLGQSSDGSSVGVYDCHGEGGNQAFLYTTDDQIRLWIPESEETTNHEQVKNVHRCLDAASPPDDPTAIPRTVRQFLCHGKGGNQEWFHRWDDHTIRHIMEESLQCLETYALEGGGVGLQVNLCDGSLGQKWTWHAPRVRSKSGKILCFSCSTSRICTAKPQKTSSSLFDLGDSHTPFKILIILIHSSALCTQTTNELTTGRATTMEAR